MFDKDIKLILRKKGLKVTEQREVVYKVLIENSGNHLTVEEIYEKSQVYRDDLGLATVYRTILLFDKLHIVDKVLLRDDIYRYELVEEESKHCHHHLICTECHDIIEVGDELLDSVEKTLKETYNFEVKNHKAKFYGLCSKCQKK